MMGTKSTFVNSSKSTFHIVPFSILPSNFFTSLYICYLLRFSVQFSRSVVSNSLWPHGLQQTRLPCHHQLPELAQTLVHRVSDAIQPSHPLLSASPAFNFSQHQDLFQWFCNMPIDLLPWRWYGDCKLEKEGNNVSVKWSCKSYLLLCHLIYLHYLFWLFWKAILFTKIYIMKLSSMSPSFKLPNREMNSDFVFIFQEIAVNSGD